MTIIDELVYDRSAQDMAAYTALAGKEYDDMTGAEQIVWDRDSKACYHISDLNRVGEAIAYMTTLLLAIGYPITTNPKTDWTEYDKPDPAFPAILADVATIRSTIAMPPTTPAVPSKITTMADANAVERIIYEVAVILDKIEQVLLRCGIPMCGATHYYLGNATIAPPTGSQTVSGSIVTFINQIPQKALRVGIYGSDSDSGAIVNIPNAIPIPALSVVI